MIRPLCIGVIALVTISAPTAAFAQSRLEGPHLDGFVVAYEATQGAQSIREEIPVGETIEHWTRMVTTQRFGNSELSALQLTQAMRRAILSECADSSMSEPTQLKYQGFEAASYSATCSRASSEGPETFYMLAVKTDDALLVKQVAFRDVATEENVQWAVAVLKKSKVCSADCSESSN